MLVTLIAKDRPDALDVRKANREAHLAYLKSSDIVRQGGPILDGDGQMCGSILVLEVPDVATAEAWAREDPYRKAALFQSVELLQWNRVIAE